MNANKHIAIVIPLFNEEGVVQTLFDRLSETVGGLPYKFRFIVVDDGSVDGTLAESQRRQAKDPRITIAKLSRNWGHQNAFNAGIDIATGMDVDACILMDGDLEDPPEIITDLISEWERGADIVYTVKSSRQGSWFRRVLTFAYYKLVKLMGEFTTPFQAGMLSLLDARVLKEIYRFKERQKSYPNIRSFVGFRQVALTFDRNPRLTGKPSQTLFKLLSDGIHALVSTSVVLIRILTIFGIFLLLTVSFLSVALIIFRLNEYEYGIFTQTPGWTSLILVILLFSSIQIIFLGILGEYIALIYNETRGRPNYIIDEIIADGTDDPAPKDHDGSHN